MFILAGVFINNGEVLNERPSHMRFDHWGQMSEDERNLHRDNIAGVVIKTAEFYNHNAMFAHPVILYILEKKELARMISYRKEETECKI